MKTIIEDSNFDTKLEASDWRYSASIVGLIKYFDYHQVEYKIEDDFILYNGKDIDENKYLEFVEYNYGEELHHKLVENMLLQEELCEEQIKIVNEKLANKSGSSNTIMKKVFSEIQFNGSNKEEILDKLNSNRYELIKETFKNKKNMYTNYCNPNQLFNDSQKYCRIQGYYIDAGKKGKSIGYNFTQDTFKGNDELEFDFIPFAFIGDREAFFINDNFNIKKLKTSNDILNKKLNLISEDSKKDSRKILFKSIQESADFIDYDVEVIYKDRDKDYFETLYIRKSAINILKNLKEDNFNYDSICFSYKVNDNYYINMQKEVTNNILNNIVLDELIELILKDRERKDKRTQSHNYKISQMININILIRGDREMKDRLKGAYACAKKVVEVLPDNKVATYRQKLISTIIFKDYDRANQILLQLSNYSGIEFGFVYDLFENFEDNKDLVYTFINALVKDNKKVEEIN